MKIKFTVGKNEGKTKDVDQAIGEWLVSRGRATEVKSTEKAKDGGSAEKGAPTTPRRRRSASSDESNEKNEE